MQLNKKTILIIILAVFGSGYFVGFSSRECKSGAVIDGKATTNTVTSISYIPRENNEKTDIDIKIKKPDLAIKINGKDAVIKKADNEDFIFQKNKLALNQESKISFDIKSETIDNTRKWGFGVLYDNNNNLNGALMFPAIKLFDFPINGFVSAGKTNIQAGLFVMVK